MKRALSWLAHDLIGHFFSANNYTGSFTNIVPTRPGAGLMWDKSLLNTSGTLKVAVLSIPTISNVPLSGPDIVINGAGGPANETYHVLAATNEALPLTNGSRMATNVFDGNGNFSFTNAITTPQRCYLLQLP